MDDADREVLVSDVGHLDVPVDTLPLLVDRVDFFLGDPGRGRRLGALALRERDGGAQDDGYGNRAKNERAHTVLLEGC